jgi:hypothetical protein
MQLGAELGGCSDQGSDTGTGRMGTPAFMAASFGELPESSDSGPATSTDQEGQKKSPAEAGLLRVVLRDSSRG